MGMSVKFGSHASSFSVVLQIGLGLMWRMKIVAEPTAFSRENRLDGKIVEDLHWQKNNV